MSSTKSICVFCGARSGLRPEYTTAATETGQLIADEGWRLVYGAGDIGLMGDVARAAKTAGGDTLGVMPMHLVNREIAKRDLGQLILTETMHERKKVMFMNCDAIVVLPGGGGSLDEFFEVLTWRQLGLHAKPIFLLDVAGYWQPLLALLDHVIAQGFADETMRSYVEVVTDAPALRVALRKDFSRHNASSE
ncbi:TIGR00730 family Rossman fold protein [Pseudorhodobacter ferrugineus]|uniref:LOG family protein n=1 Tax=Pseudorhodobacter ferrugineus TaxID=77008 RepID=UPI0003B5FF90|nr:TIGR00730 family Rossman fold protein [Pseudorhodobacter ferrugineus]